MNCQFARERLPALVCGELPAGSSTEVRRHLSMCPSCRRAWAALDPVGATQAFGTLRPAPPGVRERIMAEVRMLPPPSRAGTRRDTAMLGLSAVGMVGLWLILSWIRPLTDAALTAGLRALVAGVATAGTALAVTVQVMNPVILVLAGVVVIAELALVGRWMRTAL